jgi:hypothetical protein
VTPSRPHSAASSTAPSKSRSDRTERTDRTEQPARSDRAAHRGHQSGERGSATVETALVIPVLVLLTLALCGVVSAMATQIRCIDAARLGARAAARGEADDAVRAAVRSAGPNGTQATFATAGGLVHVDVSAPVSGFPLLQMFTVHAEAEAADESADENVIPDTDGNSTDHTRTTAS